MAQDEEPIISKEFAAWIGYVGPTVPMVRLFESDVRRYVDATGDAHPLWLDDQFASGFGHNGRLLPPLMVGWTPFSIRERAPDQVGEIRAKFPIPAEYTHRRNVSNETEWVRPVHLGEGLFSRTRVHDIAAKQTRFGVGIFVTQVQEILDEQAEIVSRRTQTSVDLPESKATAGNAFPARPLEQPADSPSASAPTTTSSEPGDLTEQRLYFDDLRPGDPLPMRVHGPLTILDTVRWAGVQENSQQLHYDRDFVREHNGLPTFIASGAYREALLVRMLTDWAGPHGMLRRISVRQLHSTFEGDSMRFSGQVTKKSQSVTYPWTDCELEGTNQDGKRIVQGRCTLVVPVR